MREYSDDKGAPHAWRKGWQYKHHYVWEQAHGKIPSDCVIVFLDGDESNYALENLYCVKSKINAMMSRYKWHFENAQAKLTAIKWCELYYTLKQPNKEPNQNGKLQHFPSAGD